MTTVFQDDAFVMQLFTFGSDTTGCLATGSDPRGEFDQAIPATTSGHCAAKLNEITRASAISGAGISLPGIMDHCKIPALSFHNDV